MSDTEQRLTELELRYMQQTDLIEQLNAELLAVNTQVQGLDKRVDRLERQLEDLLKALERPAVDKPPHY